MWDFCATSINAEYIDTKHIHLKCQVLCEGCVFAGFSGRGRYQRYLKPNLFMQERLKVKEDDFDLFLYSNTYPRGYDEGMSL